MVSIQLAVRALLIQARLAVQLMAKECLSPQAPKPLPFAYELSSSFGSKWRR